MLFLFCWWKSLSRRTSCRHLDNRSLAVISWWSCTRFRISLLKHRTIIIRSQLSWLNSAWKFLERYSSLLQYMKTCTRFPKSLFSSRIFHRPLSQHRQWSSVSALPHTLAQVVSIVRLDTTESKADHTWVLVYPVSAMVIQDRVIQTQVGRPNFE